MSHHTHQRNMNNISKVQLHPTLIVNEQDPDWTKEETDYLWSLCPDFDLRWIIITDRYEWPDKTRTMEDLKDRYYSCVRGLLAGRTPESLMTASQLETYNSYKWDKGFPSPTPFLRLTDPDIV